MTFFWLIILKSIIYHEWTKSCFIMVRQYEIFFFNNILYIIYKIITSNSRKVSNAFVCFLYLLPVPNQASEYAHSWKYIKVFLLGKYSVEIISEKNPKFTIFGFPIIFHEICGVPENFRYAHMLFPETRLELILRPKSYIFEIKIMNS